ncbi:saccharopine dehydrogenase [Thecamonas trahens ATCC 50062]|uniref:Saccharopine dehydrogenase n=1 Tax=Thecamonas trahens ATCC 50062 TaxID=461836 RepID=A0A0L0D5Y3_THETB|nr:saccharopine dehydrogenase [Thecamonas trahens ATCC 50062]KNC47764.1 saccharopine dehydrogenase [Thecamonas trahens ATCC 50062]|eukprot:XP_013759242.1 saccharopine dehydrogenase [Thecamonas trahens ATCC 50062]
MAGEARREFDVVVWGATGFTGSLVAKYLATYHPPGGGSGSVGAALAGADDASRPLSWAVAGRSPGKLETLVSELAAINPACAKVPVVIGDATDRASLDAMAARTSCVASTAGPFFRFGTELVRACVAAGTQYCDITGESPWVRAIIDELHEEAEANNALIVSCCGFDSVPADLGVHMLVRHVQDHHGISPGTVTAGVGVAGGASGGTIASIINLMDNADLRLFADAFLLNPRENKPRLADRGIGAAFEADRKGVAWDQLLETWTGPFLMAGVNTRVVRRSAALAEQAGKPYAPVFRYNEAMRFRSWWTAMMATSVLSIFGIMLYFRATRWLLMKIMPSPGQGPSEAKRDASHFSYNLATELPDGTRVRARVAGGDPGYTETSKMIAEAAIVLSRYKSSLPVSGGVVPPAYAMGDVLRTRLVDAGMTFKIVDP